MFNLICDIITIPIAIIGYLSLGVCEMVYSGYSDVSNEKKFEYLLSKDFELKEDMFYFRWSDTGIWSLHNTGCSYFPASIEDYEKDPENWMYTDANAQKGYTLDKGYGKEKITGIVRSGTTLKVIKVLLRKSIFNGNKYSVIARMEDGEFAGRQAEISSMFDICSLRESEIPEIDEEKLFRLKSITDNTALTSPAAVPSNK